MCLLGKVSLRGGPDGKSLMSGTSCLLSSGSPLARPLEVRGDPHRPSIRRQRSALGSCRIRYTPPHLAWEEAEGIWAGEQGLPLTRNDRGASHPAT